MATYAAMVEHLDRAVGRVVEALRRNDRFDDTLILFCSDNGACSEHLSGNGWNTANNVLEWAREEGLEISVGDDHDTPTGGPLTYHSVGHEWANAQNTPLRRYKANVHEGGACSAGIAHWPAGIDEPGRLTRTPVHVIDVMPTVLELARAKYPEKRNEVALPPMEGVSLLPILRGKDLAKRALFFKHGRSQAIREGRWKLVQEGDGPWRLYDLATDRSETQDLSHTRASQARDLQSRWEAWNERVARE